MTLRTKIRQKSEFALFCCCSSFILIACGGGNSNSGGPSGPPPPLFTLYSEGRYSGTLNLTFEGENISDSSEEPTSFSPQVLGGVAGTQQIRIAFRQFSGTSAIVQNGVFSIPSGQFGIAVRGRAGSLVTRCNGEFLFEGRFASATTLSGNVSTTQTFICDDSRYGPVTASGPFEASFGTAKQGEDEFEISAKALTF